MKRILILILFTSFVSLKESYCQFETIFGSTNTEWNFISLLCDAAFVKTYIQERDSTLDNVQYKVIDGVGLLRESNANSKLWFREFDDENEILIMDLELIESDTFVFNSIQFTVDSIYFEGNEKIIEFDFIPSNCGFYERLKFQEGRGPNMSFMFGGDVGEEKILRCQTKDSVTINYLSEFGFGEDCENDLVSTKGITNIEFQIIPNPTTGQLEFIFASSGKREVRLYDTRGINLLYLSTIGQIEMMNIHHLPDGIYFVQIIEDGHINIKKVIKSNQ